MKIKILGDSIAAGEGCSTFVQTEEVLMDYPEKKYYRNEAPNSWWGILKSQGHEVTNWACSGSTSTQLREHFEKFVEEQDELLLINIGLNDRKEPNGMEKLRENLAWMIGNLKEKQKNVAFMTPMPSTYENEHKESRIYHTEDVLKVLREVTEKNNVKLIDNHAMAVTYLQENNLKIEDILFGEGCVNDGLHPGDFAQKLMYENIARSGVFSV